MRVGRMASLEKLHGIGSGSMPAVGTLVSIMSFVLAKETEDGIARDVIEACDDLAGLDKSHAVFVSGSRGRFRVARNVATGLSFSDWWFEIDQQAVGCGQGNRILVITSGTTVSSLEERQSEGALTCSLDALRCIR